MKRRLLTVVALALLSAGCTDILGRMEGLPLRVGLDQALVKDGMVYVQAGAGIVADSDPQAEQLECEYKAKGLFRAAEEAVRFAAQARRGNR